MKQLRSIVLGLLPPGSMLASVQKYQDRIFRETGNPSASGVLPILPLCSCSEPVDPPEELRLDEALSFLRPLEYRENWYLPLENSRALNTLTEKLPLGYAQYRDDEKLLFPLFPGLFLCRGGAAFPLSDTLLSDIYPPDGQLRSASFSAVLVEYRCSRPRDGWWDSIEERIHWELRVRKPAVKGR
ncbi:hypothetical protein [Marispirochaeta aestuarii]|uniref:hypothetical protein n=1 Tax=Marispirochaeta aestuarii TaxID=1963862 RepID=UPI0029C78E31|nr:hypothetical protein [Marispirochaeta aestuarii]